MAIRHQQVRKRIYQKLEPYPHPDRLNKIVDKAVYFTAFASPIANIPQLYEVWANRVVQGISVVSWSCFVVFSFIWSVYGFLHNDKPILIMNGALFVLQLLIVIGVVIYR